MESDVVATAQLETRPLYGIGTVARLTRMRPETLRIWERRYGLGASQKSAKGRRMYTQTDLEHLQIVVHLIEQGYRIGEIAAMERKTLEAIQKQSVGGKQPDHLAARKTRVLFIGRRLCDWLDKHPGCLSSLDSRLWRDNIESWIGDSNKIGGTIDLVALECGSMSHEKLDLITELKATLNPSAMTVLCKFNNKTWDSELEKLEIYCADLTLNSTIFARHMRRMQNQLEVKRGASDAGELVEVRPRLFSGEQLELYRQLPSELECGCSQHLSSIIQSLVNFEDYSSSCAVDSWSDAATHSCVHVFTNQARWLIEKALQTVLEEQGRSLGTDPEELQAAEVQGN